ncbi:GNAT family N-acetyltransferase [Bacillus smithii]|uniref:GNAT family N-acetyltransferase n=1 Tax=Bacillus smithii TaxID=1479 RepID=UPI002E1CEE41|nr:GNAT family N-acetyltransferase [Bacillus smithii]
MQVKVVETKHELEQVFQIRKKVFVEEQHVPIEEEIDQYEKEAVHFLLLHHGDPAGAGRFRIVDGKGKAERICVLPETRGSGAGKAIMEAIEEYARSQNVPALKLNAQVHAIPFYEKLGYKVVSEEFMDAGIPHKTMLKEF